MLDKYIFTSESVSEGHPDKVCDRISDAILDEYLTHDNSSRVAVETMATTNRVILAGEVRTGSDKVDNARIEQIVKDCIKHIGYDQKGFSWRDVLVENHIHGQSVDIAVGVDSCGNKDEGAGDQGIMFGYACRDTDVLMPAPIYYSHRILENLTKARKESAIEGILPDSKSQISIEYNAGKPIKAVSIVLSTQHEALLNQDDVRKLVIPIIKKSLPDGWMCSEDNLYINPTGIFVIGGPDGDCGLTGRKIIVDTYGGAAPHGGGAFSGKDATKVDRSAAYAARYLAKNIVAADLADRCTIQFSYAIGVSKPISLYINTHGTGRVIESKLVKAIDEIFDLSPRAIRERLDLSKPIYTATSSYGHFGRDSGSNGTFSWEKVDLKDDLLAALT